MRPIENTITVYELPPPGVAMPPKPVAMLEDNATEYFEVLVSASYGYSYRHNWLQEPSLLAKWSLFSRDLRWLALRDQYIGIGRRTTEEEEQTYALPLSESFRKAAAEIPSVSVDPNVMAGAPCIEGTRIPVYMILDAIEYYGSLEGAMKSYPRLSFQQVKDAIAFSKLVVECPIAD